VGTAEWNLVTDKVRWSQEVYRFFGRDPALGALTLDQLPAHLLPEDQLPVQRMITAALVDRRELDGEFRIVRADGSVRTVHCSGEPVVGEDGYVVSLRTVLRDVGEVRGGVSAPGRARRLRGA
jgi:PAS domain-containing protein